MVFIFIFIILRHRRSRLFQLPPSPSPLLSLSPSNDHLVSRIQAFLATRNRSEEGSGLTARIFTFALLLMPLSGAISG